MAETTHGIGMSAVKRLYCTVGTWVQWHCDPMRLPKHACPSHAPAIAESLVNPHIVTPGQERNRKEADLVGDKGKQ